MPHFKYRLEPLLDQRRRDLDAAEELRIKRRQEVLQAERRYADLQEQERDIARRLVEGRRHILDAKEGQPLTAVELDRRKLFLMGLALELESLKDAVFSQSLAVEEARNAAAEADTAVSACRRAVEIFEKHRAKLETRFKAELEQKEALEQDELGNVMYLMQRAK